MLGLELGEADILQGPRLGVPRSHLCPRSYNYENFIYLADFPKEQSIKYLVNSFRGDMAIVTETEEVGYPAPLPKPQRSPFSLCQGKRVQGRKCPQGSRGRAAEDPGTQREVVFSSKVFQQS